MASPRLLHYPTDGASWVLAARKGEIHGTRKSKIYYLPECSGYERMSPANRVPFASEAAAVQASYRKARNCP
jgi:hypothetical protein